MLPHLSGIPIQTAEARNDSAASLNRLLPVAQNVSATVVAVSRDQIQPEIFRLKLEINNRLIQLGVFQPLPVGQKINVNRQSDGQIQITLPPSGNSVSSKGQSSTTGNTPQATPASPANTTEPGQTAARTTLTLQLSGAAAATIARQPLLSQMTAAVISSRPLPATASAQAPTAAQPTPSTTTASASSISSQAQAASPPAVSGAATASSGASNNTSGMQQPAQAQITGNSLAATQTQVQTQPQAPAQTQAPPAPSASNQVQGQIPDKGTATVSAEQTGSLQAQTAPGASARSNTTTTTSLSAAVATSTPATSATQSTPQPTQPPAQLSAPSATQNTATASNSTPTQPQSSTPQPTQQPVQQSIQQSIQQSGVQPAQQASSAQPSQYLLTLALPNGTKIEVVSPQPLAQGTQVQLVKSSAIELQVQQARTPELSPASALERPAVRDILRTALPLQQPTGDAFTQLAQAVSQGNNAQSQIGNVVRSMLQLFGVSPGSSEAPTQIRNNIELGGMTTERMLGDGKLPPPQEMKNHLQQLKLLAENMPTEQRERFESLLQSIHSRLTSQQLNSLQQWREFPDGGFERVLQLDLPIKQGDRWDNLELRLSREGGSNAAGEMISVWRVRLHFDLDELGGVDAEIRLTDGHEIRTLFWCEQKDTAEKLRARSEEFSERLRQCGFSQSEVNWHEGSAPTQQQSIHKQLIDLHT